jgi:death-on-curing protein
VTRFLDLGEFIEIAEAVTGLDRRTIERASRLDLADSALHAPAAGFADQDLYESMPSKAAVLLHRLAQNHPLPDGNKRAAWVSMRMFIELNGWGWIDRPSIDEAEAFVLAVAAGERDEQQIADWLAPRIGPATESGR